MILKRTNNWKLVTKINSTRTIHPSHRTEKPNNTEQHRTTQNNRDMCFLLFVINSAVFLLIVDLDRTNAQIIWTIAQIWKLDCAWDGNHLLTDLGPLLTLELKRKHIEHRARFSSLFKSNFNYKHLSMFWCVLYRIVLADSNERHRSLNWYCIGLGLGKNQKRKKPTALWSQ